MIASRWILLLNFNTADLCVGHARQFAGVDGLGVLIVDNASRPDDRTAVTTHVEAAGGLVLDGHRPDLVDALTSATARGGGLVLLRSAENLGYGGGNNFGLRLLLQAFGDDLRVIVTNPDVSMPTDVALALLEDPSEICGPAVHEAYAGGLRTHEGHYDYSTGFSDEAHWRLPGATGPWLSGCCLRLSGTALRRYGLLPEETFLYDEEMFFFARVLKGGGVPVYRADLVVRHAGSVSVGGKKSFHYFYYIFRNRWLYYRRVAKPLFGGRWRFYVLYVDWMVGAGRGAWRRRNRTGIRGILTGAWHGIRGIDGRYPRMP